MILKNGRKYEISDWSHFAQVFQKVEREVVVFFLHPIIPSLYYPSLVGASHVLCLISSHVTLIFSLAVTITLNQVECKVRYVSSPGDGAIGLVYF